MSENFKEGGRGMNLVVSSSSNPPPPSSSSSSFSLDLRGFVVIVNVVVVATM
jgi:hypothetical protein